MDRKSITGNKPMIDNRKVKDSHQEGIGRVIQRKSERIPADHIGHQGKMGMHKGNENNFKRSGDCVTPRKA